MMLHTRLCSDSNITLLVNYSMGVMVALLKDRVVSDCAREVSLHACMVQVSSLYTVTDVCLYGSFHTSGLSMGLVLWWHPVYYYNLPANSHHIRVLHPLAPPPPGHRPPLLKVHVY